MNYIPLETVKFAWIFRHQSMPLAPEALDQIKIMSPERAAILWDSFISKSADHPDFFKAGDWPSDKATWLEQGKWQGMWESDNANLPDLISEHLAWEDNTVVYYCINRKQVIETNWKNFKRCWKNLLFIDDGTLLIGKKRNQVVQFQPNGYFKIGTKPG